MGVPVYGGFAGHGGAGNLRMHGWRGVAVVRTDLCWDGNRRVIGIVGTLAVCRGEYGVVRRNAKRDHGRHLKGDQNKGGIGCDNQLAYQDADNHSGPKTC